MGLGDIDCWHVPHSTASNAGVAGLGVLLSFIITIGIAFILSGCIVIGDLCGCSRKFGIPRKVLLSISDQQIITGIGIQAIGLAKFYEMVPYHFFVIWLLSSTSTATHSVTLLALCKDFRRDWVLRWAREVLMLVNLVLSLVCGAFVVKGILKAPSPTLPIGCAWLKPRKQPQKHQAISIVGTAAVMFCQLAVFLVAVGCLHVRKAREARWVNVARSTALGFLLVVVIGAVTRVIKVSQAFGEPNVRLADEGEKEWSYGQLLPLLLFFLPAMSVLEMWRGERRVPPAVAEGQQPQGPGAGVERDVEFDPNPFFTLRMPLKVKGQRAKAWARAKRQRVKRHRGRSAPTRADPGPEGGAPSGVESGRTRPST